MELNGWSSPQMLRRYGASARSARARRSYDRIMDMPCSAEGHAPGAADATSTSRPGASRAHPGRRDGPPVS